MTKPSTVFKLKTNFLSLLADHEQVHTTDIMVSVVKDSRIISIMVNTNYFLFFFFSLCTHSSDSVPILKLYVNGFFFLQSDEKQLTPCTNRRTKLYILKPSQAPESLYVQDNDTRRAALSFLAGRGSTMYYSPQAESTTEFMSAPDEVQSNLQVDKYHLNRQTSINTSTPKPPQNQRIRSSLSTVYRLSGTCSICLEEKADREIISHDKCGSLFCCQCIKVSKLK